MNEHSKAVVVMTLSLGPLQENMTSSTNPEVRNLLQYHRRTFKPGPQATSAENLVNLGHVVFEIREHTLYRQTDS